MSTSWNYGWLTPPEAVDSDGYGRWRNTRCFARIRGG